MPAADPIDSVRANGIVHWKDARAVRRARRYGLWWAEGAAVAHLWSAWPKMVYHGEWCVHPVAVPSWAYKAFCGVGMWLTFDREHYRTPSEAFEEFCRCFTKLPPAMKFRLLSGPNRPTPEA